MHRERVLRSGCVAPSAPPTAFHALRIPTAPATGYPHWKLASLPPPPSLFALCASPEPSSPAAPILHRRLHHRAQCALPCRAASYPAVTPASRSPACAEPAAPSPRPSRTQTAYKCGPWFSVCVLPTSQVKKRPSVSLPLNSQFGTFHPALVAAAFCS